MRLDDNDFKLFGLPERQALARDDLDGRWRRLQATTHPDKFAADGAAAQRLAMQWAVRVNEAYRRLKDPLARASYLCELRGAPIDAERNTAMPPAFLTQQMQWREALDEAGELADVQALDERVAVQEQQLEQHLQTLLDDRGDAQAAAARVRAWMFVRRFREDIERRIERFETAH